MTDPAAKRRKGPEFADQDPRGFFVDQSQCVACGCCEAEAPELFELAPDGWPWRVKRQPETADEFLEMRNAFLICCVECICYGGRDPQLRAFTWDLTECEENLPRFSTLGRFVRKYIRRLPTP